MHLISSRKVTNLYTQFSIQLLCQKCLSQSLKSVKTDSLGYFRCRILSLNRLVWFVPSYACPFFISFPHPAGWVKILSSHLSKSTESRYPFYILHCQENAFRLSLFSSVLQSWLMSSILRCAWIFEYYFGVLLWRGVEILPWNFFTIDMIMLFFVFDSILYNLFTLYTLYSILHTYSIHFLTIIGSNEFHNKFNIFIVIVFLPCCLVCPMTYFLFLY